MSFWAIIELITAVLKAPAEMRALIILLSKTPQERAEEIAKAVQSEYESVLAGGRPKWD